MSQDQYEGGAFRHEDAWRAGSALVAHCQQEQLPVTVAIWLGEQRVFHSALKGSSADNDSWVERKAATVRRFNCSTQEIQNNCEESGTDFFSRFVLDPGLYAPYGGAIPVLVQGSLVGVIAVSGLTHGPISDHDLALLALESVRSWSKIDT